MTRNDVIISGLGGWVMRIRHGEEDAHSESRHHDYDRPPCLFQANKHSPKGEHGGPSVSYTHLTLPTSDLV